MASNCSTAIAAWKARMAIAARESFFAGLLGLCPLIAVTSSLTPLFLQCASAVFSTSRADRRMKHLQDASVELLGEQVCHRHRKDRISQRPHAQRCNPDQEDDAPDEPPLNVFVFGEHHQRDGYLVGCGK